MKFLDGKTKKWLTLAAMVLLAVTALGVNLNFMDTEIFGSGFKVIQLVAAVTIIGAYWLWNKELSLA